MHEVKIGGVEFTGSRSDTDPYIIAAFGYEGSGKTRFGLTGPEVIGVIALERKSYFTVQKDAIDMGKRVLLPKDPDAFIINPRIAHKLATPKTRMDKDKEEADRNLRQYYRDHVNRVKEATYGLLEHPDVRVVVIDTFGQLCTHVECAIHGFEKQFIKVEGKLYQDKRESNQEIIDFINSLSPFGKTVILVHKAKDEYSKAGPTGRSTWDGFKFLGNHTNVMVEFESNRKWNPNSENEDYQWHWRMNVRKCQKNPVLEGPDGNPLLMDEMIGYAGLITAIDPNADASELM